MSSKHKPKKSSSVDIAEVERKEGPGGKSLPVAPARRGSIPRRPVVLAQVKSDVIRAAIPPERLPYPLLPGPESGGNHCWSQLDACPPRGRCST
jgi:hypothetical protein